MFFKKKPIQLDCYTFQSPVYDLFKVDHAKRFFPQWWKNVPNTFKDPRVIAELPTIKTCTGVANFFTTGLVIPMWSDAKIGLAKVNTGFHDTIQLSTQFADGVTKAQLHEQGQIGPDFMPDSTYLHFKIYSPWVFSCNEDINWAWSQPTYNFKNPDDLIILPGTLDFKNNSNVFVNLSMRKMARDGGPNLIELDAGQPLVHLTPLTEREVVVKNHLVSKEEWQNIYAKNNHVFFFNNFNRRKVLMKKQTESKCPFGFGKK